jgi:hypothetical protein
MALILIGFALIALIDLRPIIQRHSGRGAAAFLLLFTSALALAILQQRGVEVPSIMLVFDEILKALGMSY